MCEHLPHFLTFFAIYAVYFLTFLLAGGGKVAERRVPQWFIDQFSKSFLAKVPGLAMAYWSIAAIECLVPVLLLVSLGRLEFVPGSDAYFLKLAVGVSSILFAILGFGQRLVVDFPGAANSFFYFAGTLVTQIAISTLR